jgi:hypothetical protein
MKSPQPNQVDAPPAPFAVLRLDSLTVLRFKTRDEVTDIIADLIGRNVAVVALKFNALGQCYAVQEMSR